MSLMFEFDTFMSEKIKPGFEAGKIKDIEAVHYRLDTFLKKWIKANTEKIAYGVNDQLFDLMTLMNRLVLLENLVRQGCKRHTFQEYSALYDIVIDRLDKETDELHEILEKFNEKFPGEAVNLEG
jgi:hypothetical protein